MVGTHDSVFYAGAIDLVTAYGDLGYQIFEPNVRAHIKNSKVNSAIRHTLLTSRGRKEFRLLNNGITIICRSFEKPRKNRVSFKAMKPGVVNGLQTVVSLHDAYSRLSQEERREFEKSAYVLVRLLDNKAVSEINNVVISTNTQNQMEPRNLKSNTEEQILFEKLFANLGWFYERKQGAWDAFKNDPARWRTLGNYRKSSFQAVSGGRKRERRIDNESAAQSWLAFIGFSNEAVHKKREIFDDDTLYNLSFLLRTRKHGASYEFEINQARNDAQNQAPSPELLLLSQIARELARSVPLSPKDARSEAISRLGRLGSPTS